MSVTGSVIIKSKSNAHAMKGFELSFRFTIIVQHVVFGYLQFKLVSREARGSEGGCHHVWERVGFQLDTEEVYTDQKPDDRLVPKLQPRRNGGSEVRVVSAPLTLGR